MTKLSPAKKTLIIAALTTIATLGFVLHRSSTTQPGFSSLSPAQRKFNFHGEYGLFVKDLTDEVEVNWITAQQDSGYLKVLVDGILRHSFTTPRAQAHTIKFPKKNLDHFVLRYGGIQNDADKNETAIALEKGNSKAQAIVDKVDSVFVVGDVHGRFKELIQLLTNGEVIDAALNWSGGRAHLVMLGDLFDRGYDVTRVLWFLYGLEQEATRHGGRVHIVLGNHEIMTIIDDLRYLSGKEKLIANYHNTTYPKLFDIHESVLGKWLATKPGILKINNTLFAHGGVTPNYAHYTIKAYNDSLFSHMHEPIFYDVLEDSAVVSQYDSAHYMNRLDFFFGDLSPFWFRGYVQSDTLGKYLKYVLKKFDAEIHVVAHTPVKSITGYYNGDLIAVDLHDAATEMLLLVRKKKNHKRFKYDMTGKVTAF